MMLESDQQLENTRYKLALLDKQIVKARARPAAPGNADSIRSLVQMANQLREEIVRYEARRRRRAS
jgi:hypothetical protein